jgi:hypothetical protein
MLSHIECGQGCRKEAVAEVSESEGRSRRWSCNLSCYPSIPCSLALTLTFHLSPLFVISVACQGSEAGLPEWTILCYLRTVLQAQHWSGLYYRATRIQRHDQCRGQYTVARRRHHWLTVRSIKNPLHMLPLFTVISLLYQISEARD